MDIFEITQPSTEREIDQFIDRAKTSFVGKELPPRKIAKVLQRRIRPRYGVIVNAEVPTSGLEPGNMNINAYFDHSEWDSKYNIEVVLTYHKDDAKGLVVDENGWRNLAFKTKQALMHELIHRAQYTKREGFDPRTEHDVIEVIRKFQRSRDEEQQEYLSQSDEVEAHAHDIALELRNSLSSANEIRNVLRNFSKIPQSPDKVPSLSLWVYGKYFKRNPSHPVVKVMLRKTYRYLQHYMEI